MPRRKYSKTRTDVTKPSKRITLPIELERYQEIIGEPDAFRHWVDRMIERYPELFPGTIEDGYTLHDMRSSRKMPDVRLRRIKLKGCDGRGKALVFTIAPSGVLPYMTGYTDDVEKPLFLRRFGVPFWALSYVFGRNDLYWYRLASQVGRHDIIQTTVKDSHNLPKHLLADEKHVRFNGQKAYIATTVAADCVLGASISLSADTEGLTEAYGHFKREAQHLQPGYQPETVNTDGWSPTQNAWRALFPAVIIIECFLHAFLKIRSCCKKRFQSVYQHIKQQVWDIYHAPDPDTFQEGIQAFHHWAQQAVTGTALEAINKLCAKADRFLLAFDYPDAYRTSNMIDRHMDPMDRWLCSSRFFHGHLSSAERQVRAWALFHNFSPYCPRAKVSKQYHSPAHKLNDVLYHDNWLHNLLISASMAGADP
jgi:hypothetical protein